MTDTKKRGGVTAVFITLAAVLAVAVAFVANTVSAPRIQSNKEKAEADRIALVFETNAGYEDITDYCHDMGYLADANGVDRVYSVKSTTGGKDSFCVLAHSQSRGAYVETVIGFTFDGTIVAVRTANGTVSPTELKLIDKNGFLKAMEGIPCNSEELKLAKVLGAEGCCEAITASVNNACTAIGNMLGFNEEVSE